MELLPQLNFRRRIAGLAWARRLVVLVAVMVGLTALFVWRRDWAVFPTVVLGVILFGSLRGWEMSLRRQFIREAEFPRFLAPKLRESYPQLTLRDAELVLRGLRQFFMAHLRSGRKFVAMPSKLVDAAWHEYILHTQGYQRWCQAAFGKLLHPHAGRGAGQGRAPQRRPAPQLVLGLQGGKHRSAHADPAAAAVCARCQVRPAGRFQLPARLPGRAAARRRDHAVRQQLRRFGRRLGRCR